MAYAYPTSMHGDFIRIYNECKSLGEKRVPHDAGIRMEGEVKGL